MKDSINNSILNAIQYNKRPNSESLVKHELDSVSKQLYKIGFLSSYIENVKKKDTVIIASYILGRNSKQLKVYYDSAILDKKFLKNFSNNVNDTSFDIKIDKVEFVLNQILNHLTNNGDTFSQVSLKNISQSKNGLIAELHINKTINRKIDHIIVKGYDDFPKSFTKHYLNLKKKSVFNTDKLNFASNSIHSLPFVSEIKPPEVLFAKDSTTVYLYLQKNKSNKFDGLIGFSSDENGKLKFNGYLDLALNNIFDKGEFLTLYWKSNGDDKKLFNLSLETPYIFNTAITPKVSFNIYKQDSTFLNIKANFNIAYAINPQNSISANFQSEKSNDLRNITTQNNIAQLSTLFYGLSYTYKKPNPLKPYQNKFFINFNALSGNRTIPTNQSKDKQLKFGLEISYDWVLNNKNSIFIKNSTKLLISDKFYTNELYRIGGANSIRGFDEESIFTSSHSIINIEYRYHLANRTYLYSITDFASIQNNIQNKNTQLYSFGLGYTYKIKASLISLSYAIGKKQNFPFNFNNSRFHIKLVQLF